MLHIRPARMADLPAIMRIQAQCYTAIVPESAASMGAKIQASPDTCLVASAGTDADLCAYFLAVPWRFDSPPSLDQAHCTLPAEPDCLYLHDLAVAPARRSTGAGHALVQKMLAVFRDSPFDKACLIAIQGARTYWQKHGFEPVLPLAPALHHQISGYGADARYMQLLRPSLPLPHGSHPRSMNLLADLFAPQTLPGG